MRKKSFTAWLALCAIVAVFASCGSDDAATPVFVGNFTDNVGDAAGAAPVYDVVKVRTIRVPFTQLRVEITLAQTPKLVPKDNVAVGDEVMGYIDFDTDDNVATGNVAGGYNTFCGGIPMGVNFGVDLFSRNANGDYPIYDNTGLPTGDVATPTIVDNTLVLTVQLSKFGGDDGAAKLGIVVGNGPGPTDCAPNDNAALYTTRPRRTAW